MNKFDVTILGCGCAVPTNDHLPSAQVVDVRGKLFLVDCAEGTQLQLRRNRIPFHNISAVFISHLHGDHCYGLMGLLATFSLLDRTKPFHVYAHPDLERILKPQLDYYCRDLSYEIHFHAIDTSAENLIYEDRSVEIRTLPLCHSVPCCGFLFTEKQGLRHIRRDMIDFYGIPHYDINSIKEGADWVTPEGEVVANKRLTTPPDPVRSYAYCSDTAYDESLAMRIKGTTLLYHEATYCEDLLPKAQKYKHSTAAQAAKIAQLAGVGRLLIGHYSKCYTSDDVFLKEAQGIFPETILAKENMRIEV